MSKHTHSSLSAWRKHPRDWTDKLYTSCLIGKVIKIFPLPSSGIKVSLLDISGSTLQSLLGGSQGGFLNHSSHLSIDLSSTKGTQTFVLLSILLWRRVLVGTWGRWGRYEVFVKPAVVKCTKGNRWTQILKFLSYFFYQSLIEARLLNEKEIEQNGAGARWKNQLMHNFFFFFFLSFPIFLSFF